MKKTKSFLALLLSLCLLSPLAASCAEDSSLASSNVAENTASENPPENSAESPPVEEPPSTTPPVEDTTPPEVTPQPTPPAVKKAEYIKCTGNGVNIRAGAGTEFAVLGSAEKNTHYAVTGKVGNWYKTYYRGKTAYISTSYASVFALEKTENKVEDVIAEGYKLLGTPYVYGAVRFHDGNGRLLAGFTVQKFDCSSLMQYIFYKGANALLGLHTRAQVKQGKYVHPSDLQRGDCIFFTNEYRENNVGVERVGHVALYLGEGYILHTASDYARIEKMSAQRWDYYIEARRFI